MIEVKDLRKSFGHLPVLNGIDLSIGSGQTTAVLGPNGSGKSTLIKCILGLCRPDSGSISVDGELITRDGQHREKIGYMPQKASFPDNLTGSQVLELISDLRSHSTDSDFHLIDELSFRNELHKSVKTLSGGTRQKISAAIAFAFHPKILFLDEPTAGLDPVSCGIVKDKIIQETKEGTTVVLTSHILSDVDELAANLIYLLNGTIIFHGSLEELKSQTGDEKLDRAIATLTLRMQESDKLVGDAS